MPRKVNRVGISKAMHEAMTLIRRPFLLDIMRVQGFKMCPFGQIVCNFFVTKSKSVGNSVGFGFGVALYIIP